MRAQSWLKSQQKVADEVYDILQRYYVDQNVVGGKSVKGRAQSIGSDSDWIPTPDVRNVARSSTRSQIIVLVGPIGCGKTRIIQQSAKALNLKILEWNYGSAVSPRDFLKQCLPSTTNKIMNQFFTCKQSQQPFIDVAIDQQPQVVSFVDVTTPQKRKKPDQNTSNFIENQQNNNKKPIINIVCKKQMSILQFTKQKYDDTVVGTSDNFCRVEDMKIACDEQQKIDQNSHNVVGSNDIIKTELEKAENSAQNEVSNKISARPKKIQKLDVRQQKISAFFKPPEQKIKKNPEFGISKQIQQQHKSLQTEQKLQNGVNQNCQQQQNQLFVAQSKDIIENFDMQLNHSLKQTLNNRQIKSGSQSRQNLQNESKSQHNVNLDQNSTQFFEQGQNEQIMNGNNSSHVFGSQNNSEFLGGSNGALIVFEDAELLIQEDNKFLEYVQSQIQDFSSRPIFLIMSKTQSILDEDLFDYLFKHSQVIALSRPFNEELKKLLENGKSSSAQDLKSSSKQFRINQEIVRGSFGNMHWALNQHRNLTSVCKMREDSVCQDQMRSETLPHPYPFCGVQEVPVSLDSLWILSENEIDRLLMHQICYCAHQAQAYDNVEDRRKALEIYIICSRLFNFNLLSESDAAYSGWETSGQPSLFNRMAHDVLSVQLLQKDSQYSTQRMSFQDWYQQQDDQDFFSYEMDQLRKQFDSMDELAYAAEIVHNTQKDSCNGRTRSIKQQSRKRNSSQCGWMQDKLINSNLDPLLKWRSFQ